MQVALTEFKHALFSQDYTLSDSTFRVHFCFEIFNFLLMHLALSFKLKSFSICKIKKKFQR